MAKIPIWMELIAGILLAYDLFPKSGTLARGHDRIRQFIEEIDTRNFTSFKAVVFSGALGIFVFLMLLLWAYYKNSSNIDYNVFVEIGWFSLGIGVAWCFITLLAKILKKIGPQGIFAIGLFLSILAFITLVLLHPSSWLATSLTSFSYICFLYPFSMVVANY